MIDATPRNRADKFTLIGLNTLEKYTNEETADHVMGWELSCGFLDDIKFMLNVDVENE